MVDSARMLSFDDERWNHLTGGYKIPDLANYGKLPSVGVQSTRRIGV
jgi:hypothetical protein